MSIDYLLLGTLHRMLRQQTDLKDQLARGPRILKQASINEQKFVEALDEAKEVLLNTRKLANERQLQLDTREARIADMKAKRNSCGSNKEFQLLNEQIAADEQANVVLSDEILELLERIDTLVADQKGAEGNLAKAQQESAAIQQRVESDRDRLNAELDRVSGELKQTEKRLPIEVKQEYLRLVAANGEAALAETDKDTCLNCYRTLTRQMVDQLLLQQAVFCQGCGSLMYVIQTTPAGS